MKSCTEIDYRERIALVLHYVERHLNEPMELKELASKAYFSPYHFHRIFRAMVGESLASYMRRLRLEAAANQLLYTEKKITDISLDAGFEYLESFIRAFKRRFAISPALFRKDRRGDLLSEKKVYNYQKEDGIDMDKIMVKQIATRDIISVRHNGAYADCHHAWKTLCSWAVPQGILGKNTAFLGLCYDNPEITEADNIRYDASITVGRDVDIPTGFLKQKLDAGEYVTLIHKGPLENLSKSYEIIYKNWLLESGKDIANVPSIELYLNDPDTTPPEDLLVEIQILLAK